MNSKEKCNDFYSILDTYLPSNNSINIEKEKVNSISLAKNNYNNFFTKNPSNQNKKKNFKNTEKKQKFYFKFFRCSWLSC